jgi:hypothetical protein
MRKLAPLLSALLIPYLYAEGQTPINNQAVPVEIVATASEYVPKTTTVSHPGHAYTDCQGSTSYLGDFSGYEDANGRISGDISGRATTNTSCNTTFTPPTETSLTHYDRVNYTVAKGGQALYLLSCTQHWTLTKKERTLAVFAGAAGGSDGAGKVAQNAKGTWTECPAFTIGGKYALTVGSTSDAHLEGAPGGKPVKLDYLSSAKLPSAPNAQSVSPPQQAQDVSTPGVAKVHITSTPSGGEIYVDGKFFGNAPSDITLPAGEHVVKVTLGGKEWTRNLQITSGEVQLNAEVK